MIIFGYEIDLEKYENKIELIRQYQKYVYILVIIIISINIYMHFITPKLKIIRENQGILFNFNTILEKKKSVLKEQENIERALKELQVQLKDKANNFFQVSEFNEFSLNTLSQMAMQNKIQFESIDYGKGTLKERNIYIYPLSIHIECTYSDLVNFINAIESYQKIVQISSILITKKSSTPVRLQVTLNLKAYILEYDQK